MNEGCDFLQYITAKEAAEKWGLTVRRVQDLCKNHSIHGAVRWGRGRGNHQRADHPGTGRGNAGDNFLLPGFISMMILSSFGLAAVIIAKKRAEEEKMA